jgi:long-subunit acyl-CoA synthetase (AMP-forming)
MLDVIEALHLHSQRRPGAIAAETATVYWTFAELLQHVERAAEHLRAQDVRVIALAADNGPEWIVCDLAAHLAGVTVVPLPPFFSQQQVQHAIVNGEVDAVVCDVKAESVFEKLITGNRSRLTESLYVLRLRDGKAGKRVPVPAKISYTSGTTGSPKGVKLSWEAQNRVANSLVSVTESLSLTRHTCILPFSVLLENVAGVYAPLIAGASVVCPSLADTGIAMSGSVDGARLLDMLARTKAESVIVLPQILAAMVAAQRETAVPVQLRFVAVGGARTPETLIAAARALGFPVYEGYGLTECCSVVCMNTPSDDSPGSVGKPLPHAHLRLLDDGEIVVEGTVFDGYTGDEEGGSREVRTGDIGFMDANGFLHVRGRKRNVFVTSFGRNISPEWPEAALCASPAIVQAVVFGENRPWNIAIVTPQTDATTAGQIDAAIVAANEALPQYARIAGWIKADEAFSVANGMLTANGRIRRAQIFKHYCDQISGCYDDGSGIQARMISRPVPRHVSEDKQQTWNTI